MSDGALSAIKLEPAYCNSQNEVLWSNGRGARSFHGARGRPWNRGKTSSANQRYERRMNPKGPDGKVLLCKSCGSFRHFVANCPDSWENLSVNIADSTAKEDSGNRKMDESVLFTMMSRNSRQNLEDVILMTKFTDDKEITKCAVLDSACSSTVCGSLWMDDFLASLTPDERERVKSEGSKKAFKFGGGDLFIWGFTSLSTLYRSYHDG